MKNGEKYLGHSIAQQLLCGAFFWTANSIFRALSDIKTLIHIDKSSSAVAWRHADSNVLTEKWKGYENR
jgi:hypothetical protein